MSVSEHPYPEMYDPPTVTGIFMHQARRFGDKTMSLVKRAGRWDAITWRQARDLLPKGVMGLFALGFQKGDAVGIASRTRREWSGIDLAVLSAGGVTVALYPSASLWEMTHIVSHSGLRICFAEDDAMLDRLLKVQAETGLPEKIVLFETARDKLPDGVITRDAYLERGECLHWSDPSRFEAIWRGVKPSDLATIAYTSGTTGPPKGAMITQANLYYTTIHATKMHHYEENDFGIAFLPLTHMLQRMTVYAALHLGIVGAYAESIDKLIDNFQELHPTVQVSVPQIFERIYNRIHQMTQASSPAKRRIFRWAVDVGMQAARLQREKRPLPFGPAIRLRLADRLVFRKIRAIFGGRVKYLMCGGAPMPLYLLEFFHAVGLLILEGYGLTETVAPVAVNRAECFKFGTVGQLIPGMEGKLAPDGELLLRGKGLFQGYYKDPEATARAIDAEGWFHTGDIAEIDGEGFIRITDRKKDLIVTAGGKNIAPQNIEGLIRMMPLVDHVLVCGDRRKYLTALITLDRLELQAFAGREGLADAPADVLAGHPAVQKAVADHIQAVNVRLAPYEQIKRYKILPHEFSEASGELTPTLKMRRREIMERYARDIETLYQG
ncbi:MAG TPA: long-chain fatty acid--CoA ligase [Smithellaceae bacterium]|nr:long-chain fatty acid--CoA ligase [Smithellaceae bacterium]HOQ71585.1 long-chain fatty acid--CoA ligase [Smithellaceae bacterium]